MILDGTRPGYGEFALDPGQNAPPRRAPYREIAYPHLIGKIYSFLIQSLGIIRFR